MDIETKVELVKREPLEEVVTETGLHTLLETTEHPRHYIGLEISGLLHLGSLVIVGFKIRDFIKAGFDCRVFLADWHSYLNNKFEGDWNKIKLAANYYAEAFRFFCPGVKIILGSDLYRQSEDYWERFVRFSKQITLARNARCLTILGRSEHEKLDFGQYLYPPMQAVDIKEMNLDMAHAGMDQRKVHMLVREVFPKVGWKTPIAVHHRILPGLAEPIQMITAKDDKIVASKMSKSKPWTAIFIQDGFNEINEKLKKAWCPPKLVIENPVLEIVRNIIFHEMPSFEIERPAKYGGSINFEKYKDLEISYLKGDVHPADLKASVAVHLNKILEPVRKHFEEKQELLEVYKDNKKTKK